MEDYLVLYFGSNSITANPNAASAIPKTNAREKRMSIPKTWLFFWILVTEIEITAVFYDIPRDTI
jgi:hypothetical protein